ncbi:hypothetical protein [Mongoliibacter ruber]|uniref:RHS repeat-associated protein n=1 Tax=Mongoliibacter ruber TaxID=1750599 RepID=A0A2T0WLT9_9BACT|nr:hypothetical protein [Mongoliibacter ruber]PRY87645.1 hypothetical protein CLW00_106272 [Mongoliibacter ruber]
MAELAPGWTPYRYGFNNPVKFIDPDGMFEYSDGYSTQDSKNSTGSISFSGSYIERTINTDYMEFSTGTGDNRQVLGGYTETYVAESGTVLNRKYFGSPYLFGAGGFGDMGDQWGGDSGEYYNAGIVTGLNAANIVRGNFEFGGAVAYQELTKGGNAVRIADKAKYTGLVKYGKVIGRAGYGTTAFVAGYELATGNDNTYTWVDVGVTVLGVGAVAVFGTVASPVVAVGVIGYGIWSIAGGSDWIDSNWGYRPVNNGPK